MTTPAQIQADRELPEAHADGRGSASRLLVTGNPNVGKSVIFQLLTGRYATVSNYPGTTVAVSEGSTRLNGAAVPVRDTPGINSLLASSEDELVARDLLLLGGTVVLQVADAKNLERALMLTLELAEAEADVVLAVNMLDEANARRISIDVAELSERLGIPVAPTIATQRWGTDRMIEMLPHARRPHIRASYPAVVEEAIARMEPWLPESLRGRRALALLWLAGDRAAVEDIGRRLGPGSADALARIAEEAQCRSPRPLSALIAHARVQCAQRIARGVRTQEETAVTPWVRRLGDAAMHQLWGPVILAAVLAGMYVLVGDLAAQRAVGFLEEQVFGRWLVPAFVAVTEALVPWAWGRALLTGEYGLLTMALPYAFAIILPIVTMFFLCFGLMEDSGYLPRLAVVANRFCRLLGLNGKAVLPLVLGLGCGTMAVMTARILDTRRDRLLVTLLLALGIPCSAQLGVIMAMLAGQPLWVLGLWGAVVLTVLIAVGQLAARLIPGDRSPFLYELPPLRWPQASNVLVKTLGRVEWYVKEAVPLFFLGTLALFLLDATGALVGIERAAAPLVVSWLRLPGEATSVFLMGFLRRDFGAAGLFDLERQGLLSAGDTLVSLVTITLFVPCIAQYFMMIKERGWAVANIVTGVVVVTAFGVGGLLAQGLRLWGP
ncbi:MAG TPA: ferrous iron transport protein B [bacterium]